MLGASEDIVVSENEEREYLNRNPLTNQQKKPNFPKKCHFYVLVHGGSVYGPGCATGDYLVPRLPEAELPWQVRFQAGAWERDLSACCTDDF